MKVAELIEDLETGDRTMEHLTKPDVPAAPDALTMEQLRRIMASPVGLTGSSLGIGTAFQQSQQSLNQQWAQFGNQQNFGMQQQVWRGNTGI